MHHIHPKMGTIKDRNGKDLIEAEEIKKRWKEYTEELHKKCLNDLDHHDGVVSHSEPDILCLCEVKWALGITAANKACGGDGLPAELCKSAALNVLPILENLTTFLFVELSTTATRLEKVSFHSNPKERKCQRMFKLPCNCSHFTCSKDYAQILHGRVQEYVN